ncbi:MAG: hypothetical protein COA96_14055 [SAR86 cluster bacterium]|uniref:Glycosyltransferase RgtA/B/C/D-like domain-containing protein n=1 Tax=SAR86 cluster bacterium TaxID=2030880 RepID=A0A2A5ATA4_9GAMM|nr:MAG: hypothetical protein COA96_14055 [SAR86 cluster bacterium]
MLKSNSHRKSPIALKLFYAGFCLLLIGKLFLASVLDLYSDEVFYWQASMYPAIAYSDLPFMTALLIGIGSAIEPGSTLAARALFIILGSSLPMLVYWLARPITNSQQAIEAAALTLCLPLAGFLGLLAVPDVPLLFFGLLSIGFFERSLRTNRLLYWCATGLVVALGLCTHYRFFLYPAAAILFLMVFKSEQKQWKNPYLWLTVGISSLGLIPIAWFNLSYQLSSASFYFVDRHPWEFQASGLLHIFKQAGLVTPPLYAVFVYTVYLLYRRAANGDRAAGLLLSFSLVNILVYLLLAPWTDATSTSIHWPLSGYFPLLVFTPLTIRILFKNVSQRWSLNSSRLIVLSIPAIGFIGTFIALIGVGSQAFQVQLQPVLGSGVLSNKMAGWKEFSQHTANILQSEFATTTPVIVTDNYYTSAQTGFARLSDESYTMDNDKAIRDGRITQYRLWRREISGLSDVAGRSVLFVTEDSTLTVPDKHAMMLEVCKRVDQLQYIDELNLFNGDKTFSFYKANSLLDTSSESDYRYSPCPFPAQAWIDQPLENAELTGNITISGWAFNEDIGVEAVYLVIDGIRAGTSNYGSNRQDVEKTKNVLTDPNSPNLGFNINFDTVTLTNGYHQLSIEIENQLGIMQRYGNRRISISN